MQPEIASPLRVLMVTARYFPFAGGVETHVHETGRRLAARGVQLTIATTDPTGKLPLEEEVEGMHIVRVRAYPPQRDYYYAPAITRIISATPWDVVHCQGCHTLVAPLAMTAARRAGRPYVVTFHTGGHSSRTRSVLRGMQWRVQRPLYAHARKLIGVSAFEAAYFQQVLGLPGERFTVIPNGGAMPEVAAPEPMATTEHTGTLIMAVGRLERYKGHQRAIAAMPHVLAEIPDARLLIVGAGPYKTVLQGQVERLGIADRVEIRSIPASDRQGMAAQLAQADLVTLLSDYEAHPIAVMEALAMQRPVLVTATSGLQELADQGLVRAIPLDSSPQATAQAMMAQLRDPLLPGQVELATWDECVTRLLAVYRDIQEQR